MVNRAHHRHWPPFRPDSRHGPTVAVRPRAARPRRPAGRRDGAAAAVRLGALRHVHPGPEPAQPARGRAGPRRLRGRPRRGARPGRRQAAGWFGEGQGAEAPAGPRGVYLDGGYGVGKTHLLASLWHATPAEPALKAFGTFVELTNLVGALGFQQTVQTLSGHRLLCIDEFELDDPGDTVLVSTLLGKLVDAGVALAATSNTLPGKLGEGRFAVGRLPARDPGPVRALPPAAHRRRGLPPPRAARGPAAVLRRAGHQGRVRHRGRVAWTTSRTCSTTSPRVHPSRYGALHGRAAGGVPHRRPAGSRPVDGAAARGARRPAVRPRGAGRSPPGCPSTGCSARRC